jgi:hypothetical protein
VADKTRNININYNIRTVGVDQSRAAVASVEQATKNLQQAAPIAGQKLSAAFQQSTQSVLSMKMQLDRLKTSLELATNPAKIAQLSAQYKTLKAQIDATNKSLFEQSKAVKDVTTNTKSLTSGFSGLYSAIKTVIAAGIVREVANTAIEMARLAGNVEGVERAFKRAFADSENLLNDLQRATHGTVSEFALMQRTLQATNLGVAVEQLPVLFEFAAARAQQTGESVDYLVDSIVRGIGRKSILVLDNLGLSATRLKEQFNGASLASQSVADVTRGVAEIARVELEKMGGYAVTSATKVDQLTVAWEELKVTAAEASKGMNSGIVDFLKNAALGAQALIQVSGDLTALDELAIKNEQKRLALQDVSRIKQKEASDEAIKTSQQRFDFIQQEINSRVQLIGTYNDEIKRIRERREALQSNSLVPSLTALVKLYGEENRAGEIGNFLTRDQISLRIELNARREKELDSLGKELKAWQVNKGTIGETIDLLKQYLSTVDTVNKKEVDELGIIERKRQEIAAIQEQIESTQNSGDLSSRLGVGKLITDLAVAQAELKELLEGAINTEFKVKFEVEKLTLPSDKSKVLSDFEKEVENLLKSIGTTPIPVPIKPVIITPTTFGDQLLDEIEGHQQEIIDSGFNVLSDQLKSVEEAEVASLQNRLNNVRNYYDEQELLAGDNERVKAELRLREERETAALQKKIAEKDRQARKFSIVIDTATGIMRAFATLPTPAAIVQSAIIAALGASQLAIVSRTPARFKKGGYTGNGGVDQEVGIVHGQEYVTPAQQTKKSFGLLEAIKNNRIDDRVLRGLQLTDTGVKVVPWNNKPVVDAINSNKPPDIITIGRQMYKVFKDRDGNKRYIRSKSM